MTNEDVGKPFWRSILKFLLIASFGFALIFLSWVQVAMTIGMIFWKWSKDSGAPQNIKEFRWKMRNIDLTRDQVMEELAKVDGTPPENFENYKETLLQQMRDRGFIEFQWMQTIVTTNSFWDRNVIKTFIPPSFLASQWRHPCGWAWLMTKAVRWRCTSSWVIKLGMTVYFCDPHSPWQRGSYENTNGLVRQYLLRARICRSTARSSSMRLPMKSMAGPEKASGYDHRWQSTESYSSITPSTQPSLINYRVLHFTFESAQQFTSSGSYNWILKPNFYFYLLPRNISNVKRYDHAT